MPLIISRQTNFLLVLMADYITNMEKHSEHFRISVPKTKLKELTTTIGCYHNGGLITALARAAK